MNGYLKSPESKFDWLSHFVLFERHSCEMLQVLHAGSTELSRAEDDNALLLNCWDKSSPLIKELEQTVDFAERKCGDLMQQLNFYKKYYQKWAQIERVNTCFKKKPKKCFKNTLDYESSSENEFEKVNQYFYKKIKRKINEMSNEIIQANRKLNTKKEIVPKTPLNFILTEPEHESKTPEEINSEQPCEDQNLENRRSKSDPTISPLREESEQSRQEDTKINEKKSSKSLPARNKATKAKLDKGPVKKRYSNLQRYKLRSKSLPQGVRRKFGFGGFYEVVEPDTSKGSRRTKSRMSIRTDSCKSSKIRKSLCRSKTKVHEFRKVREVEKNFRQTKPKSDVRTIVKDIKHEPPAVKRELPPARPKEKREICQEITPSSGFVEEKFDVDHNLKTLITKPNVLLPFLRHPIPFIPCSSTSKTFNLGLNVQQVLSLIKHKRHSVTLQAVVKNSMQAARSLTQPTVNTLFISQTTTSHASAICPAKDGSEDTISILTDNRSKCSILRQLHSNRSQTVEENVISVPMEISKPERPEDVWVVEQPDPTSKDVRKVRSRCTCFPTKHCVDYHKVLRQYTGWRIGTTADGNHCPQMITCTKSRLYAIPSKESVRNDGRIELTKVQNDLLNLTRKCSSLQEQISQKCLDDCEANAELDAMESELALREIEFKDILNFYNQLMSLKEKLKSLRMKNQTQTTGAQSQTQRPKRDPLRPTPSMALTRVLRKIQGLQDKIKLIDNL